MQRLAHHCTRQSSHLQDVCERPRAGSCCECSGRVCRGIASLRWWAISRVRCGDRGCRNCVHFAPRFSGVLHGASGSRAQGASGSRSAVAATSGDHRGVVVHDDPPTTISALLKLAQNEGKQSSLGIEFQLPATHQELANQLGTVRELVSRNLMRLQAEGLLDVDARQIVVKDLDGLKALLETTS